MSSKKSRKGKKMTKEEAASRKLLLEQEATKRRQELLDQFMKKKSWPRGNAQQVEPHQVGPSLAGTSPRREIQRVESRDRDNQPCVRKGRGPQGPSDRCPGQRHHRSRRPSEPIVSIAPLQTGKLTPYILSSYYLHQCHSSPFTSAHHLHPKGIQESHLERLKANFDGELDTMSKRFQSERNKMQERHRHDMEDLRKLEADVDRSFGEAQDAIVNEYQVLKDEQSDKSLAETHALHAHIDVLLEDLRKQYRQTVDSYHEETSEHGSCYSHLKAKDETNHLEIAANAKKIRSMTVTLQQLEARSEPNLKGEGDGMNRAAKEREELKTKFIFLQGNLEKLQSVWDTRLMEMTSISNTVIRDLQRILLKGEQVVKLADLCKRHERPEERATTLLPPLFRPKFPPRSAPVVQKDTIMKVSEDTDLFWGRRARAVVDKRVLLQRQQVLNLENEHLRTLLKNCLQDFCHGTRSDAEGLRYEVPDGGDGKKAAYCVIEASHIVKHMLF